MKWKDNYQACIINYEKWDNLRPKAQHFHQILSKKRESKESVCYRIGFT
jgi:hypothetical protein